MGFDFIVCSNNCDAITFAAARMENERWPEACDACSTVMTDTRVHDPT